MLWLNQSTEYAISIMDVNGQDYSQSFDILHSLPSDLGETLKKRAYSRPLDICPIGEVFTGSNCNEVISPQAYVIRCIDQVGDNSWYFRRCAQTELCIQGIPKPNPSLPNGQLVPPTLKAYCVEKENFFRIAEDQKSQKTVPERIGAKFTAPKGKTMAVEAVMTGQNTSDSMFAASLRLSAQTSEISNNVQTWRSQVGGTAVCTDCARILIAPVPEKTQRLVIDIALKAGVTGGLLFLSSVAF